MPNVNIDLSELSGIDPGIDNLKNATAWLYPYRPYEDGGSLVTTDKLVVSLTSGVGSTFLPETPDANGMWVEIRGVRLPSDSRKFVVAIPGTDCNLFDLDHLDPDSLDPTAPLSPAWVADLAAAVALLEPKADLDDDTGALVADPASATAVAVAAKIAAAIDAVTSSDIIATTAAGALTRGKWTRVNATAGTKAMTLANAATARQVTIVEKSDSSANTVTIALGLRGSAGSLTLDSQYQTVVLVADEDLNWYVQSMHRTKASFDAVYASIAALTLVPTFEELGHGAQLPASISATTTVLLETALLPCLCPQVSLVFSGAVAASDTVYWKVELLRLRAGAVSVIVTKTSKTVASGGEGITALLDWNFDTLTFLHRLLHKGDSLALRFTPVGSPAALTGGVASYRTIPDDGGVDPVVTLVSDTFTRADSAAGLGVADTGQTYTNYGSWGISSNQAYVPATTGADAAMVDTGQSDITIQVKLATIAVGGSLGLRIRQIGDNTTGTAIQMNLGTLFYFTAPGANATIGTFSQAFVAGDSVRFVAVGSLIKVYRDAGTTGNWVLVLTVTETRNQLATVHGIRSSANAGNASRFDNLLIQSA